MSGGASKTLAEACQGPPRAQVTLSTGQHAPHRQGGQRADTHCSCSCQVHSTAARKAAEPKAGRTMERSLLRSSTLSVAAMPAGMLVPAYAHNPVRAWESTAGKITVWKDIDQSYGQACSHCALASDEGAGTQHQG